MSKTNLKEIEKIANEFNNDIELIEKKLRSISSAKSRLQKQKFKSTYEDEMTHLLQQYQLFNEVKSLLKPKKKTTTMLTQEDIDLMDYEETLRAIESIRSKKSNSRWLSEVEGDNDEFRLACQIEKMLLEHKNQIKPIDETTIRKSDLITIIDTIENNEKLTNERIVELLKGLL